MTARHAIWTLTVWAVFVFLPLGYLVECTYKPQLLLNETTRYLYQYKDLTQRIDGPSLVPGLFSGGETKEEVRAQLTDAGLEFWNVAGDSLPKGAASIQTFRLKAGVRGLVCGSELFVKVGYDEHDRLTSASVTQGGACL